MMMPNRKFNAQNSYRYGFNGKENDNEVKGEGNQYDYGFRIYDTRLGRFLSVDPLIHYYPEYTPYQFSSNSPITFIDLDGLESAWKNPTTGEVIPAGPLSLPEGTRNANGWIFFSSINSKPVTLPKQSSTLQPGSDYFASVKAREIQKVISKKIEPKSPQPITAKYTATITQETRSKEEIEESARQFNSYNIIARNMQTPEGQAGMGLALTMYSTARTPLSIAEHGYGVYDNLKEGNYGGALKYGILLGLDLSGLRSSGLSAAEQGIVKEANTILISTEFQVLRNAYKSGTYAEVTVGGRKIAYEPDLPSSGISNHAENGFYLGKEAFTKSPDELKKTVLHELYRLKTEGGSSLGFGETRPATDAAKNFADKAAPFIKNN